jgi:alkylhydroperoxidase/carboxymuconolactone decarboxylase family protein YurZ
VSVLKEVRRKRGYVLPYHRLLNEVSPELLAAYDAFYTQFTLTGRSLSAVEKETVWIALVAATRAGPSGRIHLERAKKAGMSKDAIADALALAAACESWDAFRFSLSGYPDWTDEPRLVKRYLRAFDTARGRTRPVLADIAATVAHAGRRCAGGMQIHMKRAFERGAQRRQMAEALLFALLHCGGPTMVWAMECWLKMVKEHGVPRPYR